MIEWVKCPACADPLVGKSSLTYGTPRAMYPRRSSTPNTEEGSQVIAFIGLIGIAVVIGAVVNALCTYFRRF